MAKNKMKLEYADGDVIIIDVQFLPQQGQGGVWYYFQGNYYYWNGESYVNSGGDRPTKPPVNP